MKVNIILQGDLKVIFNNVIKIEVDAHDLYIYESPCMIYQTIIPLKDIKDYTVEFDN